MKDKKADALALPMGEHGNRPLGELNSDEVLRVLLDHQPEGLKYNPEGASREAATQVAQIKLDDKKLKLRTQQQSAVVANSARAERFKQRVVEFMGKHKPCKATTMADLIEQRIQLDTGLIARAKESGARWESADIVFERKNKNGDPYSRDYALEVVREVQKQK